MIPCVESESESVFATRGEFIIFACVRASEREKQQKALPGVGKEEEREKATLISVSRCLASRHEGIYTHQGFAVLSEDIWEF